MREVDDGSSWILPAGLILYAVFIIILGSFESPLKDAEPACKPPEVKSKPQ